LAPSTNVPGSNGILGLARLFCPRFYKAERGRRLRGYRFHRRGNDEPAENPRAGIVLTPVITTLLYLGVAMTVPATNAPAEIASHPSGMTLTFTRNAGLPEIVLVTIASVATLNGIIVQILMSGRVVFGMARDGELPFALTRLSPDGHTDPRDIPWRRRRAGAGPPAAHRRTGGTDLGRHSGDLCPNVPFARPDPRAGSAGTGRDVPGLSQGPRDGRDRLALPACRGFPVRG
jgi:hypothetical protein